HRVCGSQPSASAAARAFAAWGSDSPLTQRPTVLISTPAAVASLVSLNPFSLIRAASASLGTGALSGCPSRDTGDHPSCRRWFWRPRLADAWVVVCPVCHPRLSALSIGCPGNVAFVPL